MGEGVWGGGAGAVCSGRERTTRSGIQNNSLLPAAQPPCAAARCATPARRPAPAPPGRVACVVDCGVGAAVPAQFRSLAAGPQVALLARVLEPDLHRGGQASGMDQTPCSYLQRNETSLLHRQCWPRNPNQGCLLSLFLLFLLAHPACSPPRCLSSASATWAALSCATCTPSASEPSDPSPSTCCSKRSSGGMSSNLVQTVAPAAAGAARRARLILSSHTGTKVLPCMAESCV